MTTFTDNDVSATDQFVFFWRGWPSQWFRNPFTLDAVQYNTCEQCMMAEKARVFGDRDTVQKILATTSPKAQKALGRAVQSFDEKIWNSVCRGIVYSANLAKFQQNPELAAKLLDTANRTIVEASPVDKIWGIGLAADNTDCLDPAKWLGSNWLGIALMQVRDTLNEKPLDPELQRQLEKRQIIGRHHDTR